MLLVDIKGTQIGRIPDAPITPRAGETVRFKARGAESSRWLTTCPPLFVQTVILTLRPIWGEEREYRPTHRPA
jgi:hypothetical protein